MLALALLACSDPSSEDTALDPLSWSVHEDGGYNVGYRLVELTYTPTGRSEPRTLPLNVWYPTLETEGRPGEYFGGLYDDPDVIEDAEPAPVDAFPVHVHSHGYSGFGASSAFLMRRYASHGWVVAAPDHVGNTLAEHTDDLPTWFYWVRVEDLSASLDAVAQELPVDADHALVSGHSFGGYTAFAAGGGDLDLESWQAECEAAQDCDDNDLERFEQGVADERFAAILSLAGAGWGRISPDGFESLNGPALMMTGSDDGWSGQESIWNETSASPLTWVHIQGACHQTFALGGCSELSNDDGYGLVNSYGLALGRSAILGDHGVDGILDGSVALDDRAEVRAR